MRCMICAGVVCFALPVAAGAAEALLPVPSGQEVTLYEQLEDPDGPAGLTLRYRFVAPAITRDGGAISFETAIEDIDALCATVVLPDLERIATTPDQVVITLMDRIVPFGDSAPSATQYFEAYSVADGTCTWEGF